MGFGFVTRTNLVILKIQSNHNFKKIYSTFGNRIIRIECTSNFGLKLAEENIVLNYEIVCGPK
ncbi:hypothetical protein LEP1GSC005_1032 [Leptospira santarosai str. ST188]|nr:hypothetical protein LEP1GSC005_1032 [Leptospira santarosai str. ST188]